MKIDYTELVEDLKGRLAYWAPALGLSGWKIQAEFDTTPYRDEGGSPWSASCQSDWRYMFVAITFYLPNLEGQDLDEVIVHELMHGVLSELRPTPEPHAHTDHEERVCTMLTGAFLRLKEDEAA